MCDRRIFDSAMNNTPNAGGQGFLADRIITTVKLGKTGAKGVGTCLQGIEAKRLIQLVRPPNRGILPWPCSAFDAFAENSLQNIAHACIIANGELGELCILRKFGSADTNLP